MNEREREREGWQGHGCSRQQAACRPAEVVVVVDWWLVLISESHSIAHGGRPGIFIARVQVQKLFLPAVRQGAMLRPALDSG